MTKLGYVIVYLLLLAVLTAGSFFLPEGVVSDDLKIAPEQRAKTALDILRDLQLFVGTLNTALFAACGALVTKGRAAGVCWGRIEHYAIVFTLAAGAVSYYGLYLSRIAILEMVSMGVIDPISQRLQVALALQYYGFLMGAVLLGLVFIRMMDARPTASS